MQLPLWQGMLLIFIFTCIQMYEQEMTAFHISSSFEWVLVSPISLSLSELTLWLTANVKIQVLSLSCYSKINIAKIIAILLWWSHAGFPRWSVSLPKPHCIKALELVPPVLSLICQPDIWGYYTPHHHHPPLSCWFTQSVDESLHSCNLIIIILWLYICDEFSVWFITVKWVCMLHCLSNL